MPPRACACNLCLILRIIGPARYACTVRAPVPTITVPIGVPTALRRPRARAAQRVPGIHKRCYTRQCGNANTQEVGVGLLTLRSPFASPSLPLSFFAEYRSVNFAL